MDRLAGIITAAVGFIVAVLGATGILTGFTPVGVALLLLGGLIIGLSFIDRPDSEGVDRMSTPKTLFEIFLSPTEVFRNLRRHPRWLVPLLIMALLSATYTNLFMQRLGPEYVANYQIDKTLEMSWIANNEEARKRVEVNRQKAIEEAKSPLARVGSAVTSFATSTFGYAFLALIFLLFILAMGGRMNFWQVFSAVVYAAFPVAVIRFVLNTTVLFLKEPEDIHPILGQGNLIQDNLNFLVTPKDSPVLFALLGAFSVLGLYWAWLNAIGLKHAGEKVSGASAWTASIGVYVLLVLFGMTMAALFPSFMG
jgi:hypothetical protein